MCNNLKLSIQLHLSIAVYCPATECFQYLTCYLFEIVGLLSLVTVAGELVSLILSDVMFLLLVQGNGRLEMASLLL